MPIPKTYKIAKLSELMSTNPCIEYVNGNKEFNTINEAKDKLPIDGLCAIHVIIEISDTEGNQKKAKLVGWNSS